MFKTKNRSRRNYFLLLILTMLAGLASRRFSGLLPEFLQSYVGDTLWALMVFWMMCFVFTKKSSAWIAVASIIFSFGIEISQLYHAPWIEAIRNTTPGGLVLGFGFLWSDLVCYSTGIGLGLFFEKIILKKKDWSL